ncbi:MAG: hypothetical protein RL215_392 [Planctomycetota bacterium]
MVSPCGHEVEVFNLAGGGEQEIGESSGICENEFMNDGEQITAFESFANEGLIGQCGSGIGVPDEE